MVLAIALAFLFSSHSYAFDKNSILGAWELPPSAVDAVGILGTNIPPEYKFAKARSQSVISQYSVVTVVSDEMGVRSIQNFQYHLEDDVLVDDSDTTSVNKTKIVSITPDEMVILPLNPSSPSEPIHFKRINENEVATKTFKPLQQLIHLELKDGSQDQKVQFSQRYSQVQAPAAISGGSAFDCRVDRRAARGPMNLAINSNFVRSENGTPTYNVHDPRFGFEANVDFHWDQEEEDFQITVPSTNTLSYFMTGTIATDGHEFRLASHGSCQLKAHRIKRLIKFEGVCQPIETYEANEKVLSQTGVLSVEGACVVRFL